MAETRLTCVISIRGCFKGENALEGPAFCICHRARLVGTSLPCADGPNPTAQADSDRNFGDTKFPPQYWSRNSGSWLIFQKMPPHVSLCIHDAHHLLEDLMPSCRYAHTKGDVNHAEKGIQEPCLLKDRLPPYASAKSLLSCPTNYPTKKIIKCCARVLPKIHGIQVKVL